jgi:Gluconate 2-dehydrogenase subunit 3
VEISNNRVITDSVVISRLDRRVAIRWLAAAVASLAIPGARLPSARAASVNTAGYGMNPDLTRTYKPGELWPLTLTHAQRAAVAALCDTIIPADSESPSASAVGVPDFIDEWISAPYANRSDIGEEFVGFSDFNFSSDRALLLYGLAWLDAQSVERFDGAFAELGETQQRAICEDICYLPKAEPQFVRPAQFFARFRDLTSAGFYTTPQGSRDIGYVGNIPLATFDGPPLEVLRKVGLT